MHYTKDYSGLTGKAKREAALKDTKEYLGKDKYVDNLRCLGNYCGDHPNRKTIRFTITAVNMLTGIQGYPAKALVFESIRYRRAH